MRRTIRAVTGGALVMFMLLTLAPPASAVAQINGFTPTSGPVGTVVTINGSGFTGSTAVELHGDPMLFSVDSDTKITATVAAGATTGRWSVKTTEGWVTSTNVFTVTSTSVAITSFSPTSGPVGTVVTIHGSGFLGSTVVYLKGVSMQFTVDSDTQIRATVAQGAQTGLWSVQTPTKRVWSDQAFTVTSSTTLSISSFSPTSGPVGTKVTINGAGFSGVINVYLKGVKMPFTVNSLTQITATVASGAKSGQWSVETATNRVWSKNSFTVTAGVLDITSFSPGSGPVGTVVTIRGSGFSAVTAVYLHGKTMPYTINNDSQITATVAAGAQTGLWSVQTPGNRVWSDTQFRVTSASHQRSVSLTLSGHLKASGRVTVLDGYGACNSNVPVVIKRYHHGRWHWLITVSTNEDGSYRAPLRDHTGKYVARAKEIQLVNGQTCASDRSTKHRHHH